MAYLLFFILCFIVCIVGIHMVCATMDSIFSKKYTKPLFLVANYPVLCLDWDVILKHEKKYERLGILSK